MLVILVRTWIRSFLPVRRRIYIPGLHNRYFPQYVALIGQFEFKYNFCGYQCLSEHAEQHFQYNRTSSVGHSTVCNLLMLEHVIYTNVKSEGGRYTSLTQACYAPGLMKSSQFRRRRRGRGERVWAPSSRIFFFGNFCHSSYEIEAGLSIMIINTHMKFVVSDHG
jgi:hypothetical protein